MNLLEVRDSAGYAFRNEDVQSAFEITREVFAGNFAGIRERYKDKRISSEALSLIGQMAGSTESMEMGKSMEVTNMCTCLLYTSILVTEFQENDRGQRHDKKYDRFWTM